MEADGEAALCRLNGSIVRRGGGDGFTRDLRGCVKGGWGGGAVVGVDRIGEGEPLAFPQLLPLCRALRSLFSKVDIWGDMMLIFGSAE